MAVEPSRLQQARKEQLQRMEWMKANPWKPLPESPPEHKARYERVHEIMEKVLDAIDDPVISIEMDIYWGSDPNRTLNGIMVICDE